MKRKLLSMAVGAACAASSASIWAGDMPTVYGRLDLSLQTVDKESSGADQWEVKSHASRLGFKGKSKLNDDMSVIYKYELQIDPDKSKTSSDDLLKARNQYVGLKCENMGTLTIGRMDTPLKKSQGKVDIFGDHAGDIKVFGLGENREANMLQYQSPKLGDAITVKVALQQGEGSDLDGNGEADDGIADATSISVAYSSDGIYLALAADDGIDAQDAVRFTGTYKLDDLKLGLLYQDGEDSSGTAEYDAIVASAAYKMGANTIKFQIGQGEVAGSDTDLIALGVDHKLAKKTKVYAEYTVVSKEASPADTDDTTIGFGIQHKF